MKNNLSLVSLIIPCRNEEKYIGRCLNSIIDNNYPKDKIEILVVDGMSEDETRKILERYIEKYPFIRLLENPKRYTPFALNLGVKEAKGEIIIIGGAHAKYENGYITKCIKYLQDYKADNVGGVLKNIPLEKTIISNAIVICLSNIFGVGDSYFRISQSKPMWVDTVFGGCYKKEVFGKIGLFNEKLIGSSDMDFNLRLIRNGGKILLVPDIVVYYYPKDNLKDFFFHNIRDGIWAVLPMKFSKSPMKLRHYIPFLFILTLPLSIWLYVPVSLYFSAKIALEEGNIRYFFVMPIVFAARHIGYGLGSAWGLIKLLF